MTEKEYKSKLNDKLIFYRSSLKLPKNITFGIEIEYENIVKDTVTHLIDERRNYYNDLKYWSNKSEVDIAEYKNSEEINGEISSPILCDTKTTWNDLETVLNILKTNGGIVTEKCGGHVNVGTHILGDNVNYWINFLLLWILYNEEIYSFSSGEFDKLRPDEDDLFGSVSKKLILKDIIKIKDINDFFSLHDCLVDKCHDVFFKGYP